MDDQTITEVLYNAEIFDLHRTCEDDLWKETYSFQNIHYPFLLANSGLSTDSKITGF